jgi:hypothetical protein
MTAGLLTICWVVGAPWICAAAACASPRAQRLIAAHYRPAIALGWAGVGLLLAGAFALDGAAAQAALFCGPPLAGLAIWSRGDSGDDGPEPPDDPIDWDRFMADLDRWARRRAPVAGGRR